MDAGESQIILAAISVLSLVPMACCAWAVRQRLGRRGNKNDKGCGNRTRNLEVIERRAIVK
jgi:hypothetical protein